MKRSFRRNYTPCGRAALALALTLAFTACAGRAPVAQEKAETMSNPYAAKPGDEKLTRGAVFIDKVAAARDGGETVVTISGSLPTPCHELRLRVPAAPSSGVFDIEAWSVKDPNKVCAQALEPFSVKVPVAAAGAKVTVNGAG